DRAARLRQGEVLAPDPRSQSRGDRGPGPDLPRPGDQPAGHRYRRRRHARRSVRGLTRAVHATPIIPFEDIPMNRTRLSQALLAAVIGSVALIGCKKEEPAPVPPAAPVETTPAPIPPPAALASVGSVTLGNAIDANNTIATPLTSFSTGDTIHASVATDGAGPGRLTAKWTHL